MSDAANDELFNLANLHRGYWEGTPTAKVIDRLVATNDLEALAQFLVESARLMYEAEYQNDDSMTPERAEAMHQEKGRHA